MHFILMNLSAFGLDNNNDVFCQPMSPTVRSNARWAGGDVLGVPDAVQRSSRCAAEPGPTCTLNFMAPALQHTACRAALCPEHERSAKFLMQQRHNRSGLNGTP